MVKPRDDLTATYLRSWPACVALLRQHRDLSNPLLLDVPASYWRQTTRLLVVGQETGPARWCPDLDARRRGPHRATVAKLMQRYEAFGVGTGVRVGHFWRFVRRLERALGIEEGASLWTNLNKCDLAGRRPRGLESELVQAFPVLPEELRVAQPDLVVFLTGPVYDPLIVEALGATVEPLPAWPPAALSVVCSEGLPAASFRTYHPNFLLRFCGSLGDRVVRKLVSAIKRNGGPVRGTGRRWLGEACAEDQTTRRSRCRRRH